VDSAAHKEVWPAEAAAVRATDAVVPTAATVDVMPTAADMPVALKTGKAASGRLLVFFVTPPDALLVDAVLGGSTVVAAPATSSDDAYSSREVPATDGAVATQSDAAGSVLLTRPLGRTPAVGLCCDGCDHERGSYHRRRRRRRADGRSRGGGLQRGGGAYLHAADWTCGGHRRTADQSGGSST